jgi:hypothetical protein
LLPACRGTLAARRIEGGFIVDITLATGDVTTYFNGPD